MKEFEELVQAAAESIPKQFRSYLANTMIIVEESSADGLMGLYEGAGVGSDDGYPERITLYKRSHERASPTMNDLREEIRRTLLHEVGHHFGMDEDELPF